MQNIVLNNQIFPQNIWTGTYLWDLNIFDAIQNNRRSQLIILVKLIFSIVTQLSTALDHQEEVHSINICLFNLCMFIDLLMLVNIYNLVFQILSKYMQFTILASFYAENSIRVVLRNRKIKQFAESASSGIVLCFCLVYVQKVVS